jgi:hypothetical protein
LDFGRISQNKSCQNFSNSKKFSKVIHMVDLSNETIKQLFYKQVNELTRRTVDSFEIQFSDRWIRC